MARGRRSGAKQIDILKRRKRVMELRVTEMSIRDIVKQLKQEGMECSITTVHKDIDKSLKERHEEIYACTDKVIRMELKKLDTMYNIIWSKMLSDGETNLLAADRLLKIMERKSKLLGLDSPDKIETIDNNKKIEIEFIKPDESN